MSLPFTIFPSNVPHCSSSQPEYLPPSFSVYPPQPGPICENAVMSSTLAMYRTYGRCTAAQCFSPDTSLPSEMLEKYNSPTNAAPLLPSKSLEMKDVVPAPGSKARISCSASFNNHVFAFHVFLLDVWQVAPFRELQPKIVATQQA